MSPYSTGIVHLDGLFSVCHSNTVGRPKITLAAIGRRGDIHSGAYRELVEIVFHGLCDLRFDVNLVSSVDEAIGNVILVGGHLLGSDEIDRLPAGTIVYNSEHWNSTWIADPRQPYRRALRMFSVWDTSADNAKAIGTLVEAEVRHVPLGYVPQLTRVVTSEQDIDVLFYGSFTQRRRSMIAKLQQRGFVTRHVFGVYGRERDNLIARSKIILSIHQLLPGNQAMPRIAYALSNCKAVVSEHNAGETIEADLARAFVAAPYDDIPEACAKLLGDEGARRGLEHEALRIFSKRNEAFILREALAGAGWSSSP